MTLSLECMPEVKARRLTEELRQSLTISWELLTEAYTGRVWLSLGYESWNDYTTAELGEVRLRLPRDERQQVVASLTEAGLSTRAIGSVLGVDAMTVSRDRRAGVADAAPDERSQWDEPIDAEIVDDPWSAPSPVHGDPDDIPLPPLRVVGTDGKSYPADKPVKKARRRPITDAAWTAGYELRKAVEKVDRLLYDDRLPANRDGVSLRLRSELQYAAETCNELLDRLEA